MMGERGKLKETRQRLGVSTGDFYREKAKVRRKLKKLKPIWVRFGKAATITRRHSSIGTFLLDQCPRW